MKNTCKYFLSLLRTKVGNQKKKSTLKGYLPLSIRVIGTFMIVFVVSCNLNEGIIPAADYELEFGGDLSLVKKIEDDGGLYKINGTVQEGFEIFAQNGFTWARLRLLHTPKMEGVLCNDLDYTIAAAKLARKNGMKILLSIHYSDEWADKGHQTPPAEWANLSYKEIQTRVFQYTRNVIDRMAEADIRINMVQIGNQVNNGFLWPHGKLWNQPGPARWEEFCGLLTAGIEGVRAGKGGELIQIMIYGGNGGDVNNSYLFYKNMIEQEVDFDVIGLSYYPWWHGDFFELESNIRYLTSKFLKDISIVETAYYNNNWYPDLSTWANGVQPYPPNESGQYKYLYELALFMKSIHRVNTIFYGQADEMELHKSKIDYLGRSLFSKEGNALQGIFAWKDVAQRKRE